MGRFFCEHPEEQYLDILGDIKMHGIERNKGRTSESYKSIFGTYIKFDIDDGKKMPLLHTKRVYLRCIIHELLWMVSGSTNIEYLLENNVHIWDSWATEDGELGPVYGKQFREFGSKRIDQLSRTINDIKERPQSRRHLITLWNPEDCPDEKLSPQENVQFGQQALACCHGTFIQFFIDDEKGEIHMMTHQRSCDVPVGLPFNLVFYSMMLLMVARLTNLKARTITYTLGDTHVYENQWDGVEELFSNRGKFLSKNMHMRFPQPEMIIHGNQESIDDFEFDDFELKDYEPMGIVKFPRAAV